MPLTLVLNHLLSRVILIGDRKEVSTPAQVFSIQVFWFQSASLACWKARELVRYRPPYGQGGSIFSYRQTHHYRIGLGRLRLWGLVRADFNTELIGLLKCDKVEIAY